MPQPLRRPTPIAFLRSRPPSAVQPAEKSSERYGSAPTGPDFLLCYVVGFRPPLIPSPVSTLPPESLWPGKEGSIPHPMACRTASSSSIADTGTAIRRLDRGRKRLPCARIDLAPVSAAT